MKIKILLCLSAAWTSLTFGQTNTLPTSGYIGLGTLSPTDPLTINSSPYGTLVLGQWSNGAYIGTRGAPTATDILRLGTGYVERMRIDQTGNVGIGTTSPGGKLQINSPDLGSLKAYSTANGFGLILDQYYSAANEIGASFTRTADIVASTGDVSSSQIRFLTKPASSNPTVAMIISSTGNVGLGTNSPLQKLAVTLADSDPAISTANSIAATGTSGKVTAIGASATYGWLQSVSSPLYINSAGNNTILNGKGLGNVGIGTTNPTYPLSVNGTVRAKEVIVETNWSDYVFADDYKLTPLSEVERQIKKERHLSGISSAKDVATQGVSVGDMQAKLLAKIEELTLHVIAQEKQIAAQTARIEKLENR